jgi:transposase
MENVEHIIGADLSKKTIDLFSHSTNHHVCIENSQAGFKKLLHWLRQQQINTGEAMIVMEHTGLYSFCLETFLHQHQILFTKVNALAVKRSMGLVRGKSDKIDAKRLAVYGYEKRTQLVAEPPVSAELQRLQLLYSARERLVKQRVALLNALEEFINIGLAKRDPILLSQKRVIRNLEKEMLIIETEITRVIHQDESLRKNHSLLQSIKGVGKVLATATIIKTKNFTRFSNPRKFACFCGTAPFENSSGTSIRGRTKVSHLADKQMKTLLDLSAKAAIQFDKELKAYYQRRTTEGKPKMSTINIVRNKILYRMFAVIKRQTPFIEDYLTAA